MTDLFLLSVGGAIFIGAGYALAWPWPYWLIGVWPISFGVVAVLLSRAPVMDDLDVESLPPEAPQREIGERR